MAFVCPNMVQETTETTGNGTITLEGPVSGWLDFDSQCGNGDTVLYAIENATEKETGVGTFLTGPDRIQRDTVFYSTAGGAKVSFSGGTKNVYSPLPGNSIQTLLDPSLSTGLLARSALNTYTQRTLTAGNGIYVSNGDGVSGNPAVRVASVLDYGVVADGSTDDTAAWQDAVDDGPNLVLLMPQRTTGSSIISSTVTINESAVFIVGAERLASTIQFEPSSDDVCFHFVHPSSGVLFWGGLKGLYFYSTDTTYAKTAILLEDTSNFLLENLACNNWTDTGGYDSTFLHTKGREFLISKNLSIACDRGILIDQNPNSSISADHFHFQDTFITVTSGSDKPCIKVADGTNLTNVLFDGANPWVRPGSHAFEWIDTTASAASFNIQFQNVRTEQGQDTSAYSFYISSTAQGRTQLAWFNCVLDVYMNGMYFRNSSRINIYNLTANMQSKTCLNANSTCDDIGWFNSDWGASTSTASYTGMLLQTGIQKDSPSDPLPTSGHLVVAPANDYAQLGITLYGVTRWAWSGQISDGNYQVIPYTGASGSVGIITVSGFSSSGPTCEGGVVIAAPTGAAPTVLSGTTNFETIAAGGTPSGGTLTVYSFASVWRIENNMGVTLDVVITFDRKES